MATNCTHRWQQSFIDQPVGRALVCLKKISGLPLVPFKPGNSDERVSAVAPLDFRTVSNLNVRYGESRALGQRWSAPRTACPAHQKTDAIVNVFGRQGAAALLPQRFRSLCVARSPGDSGRRFLGHLHMIKFRILLLFPSSHAMAMIIFSFYVHRFDNACVSSSFHDAVVYAIY